MVTVFRWIMGTVSVLVAGGAVLSFVIFLVQDADEWLVMARKFRRWTTVALLFWFNSEIWGRVIHTLVTW